MSSPLLVDARVSRMKFAREIAGLSAQELGLWEKGWIVEYASYPLVRVVFLVTNLRPAIAPIVAEIDFDNYDILPPSVRFLNPTTHAPLVDGGPLRIVGKQFTGQGSRDVVIYNHPQTDLPFLCIPGVREYHSHPQHNGDSWDLHRGKGEGRLFFLLHHIWLYCIRNVIGFEIVVQNGRVYTIPRMDAIP
jgi:hypothetical protein